jgi:hypothetical protein
MSTLRVVIEELPGGGWHLSSSTKGANGGKDGEGFADRYDLLLYQFSTLWTTL